MSDEWQNKIEDARRRAEAVALELAQQNAKLDWTRTWWFKRRRPPGLEPEAVGEPRPKPRPRPPTTAEAACG
jgi:hypothetical protein